MLMKNYQNLQSGILKNEDFLSYLNLYIIDYQHIKI